MIALMILIATLPLGVKFPGILLVGVFFGFPVSVLSETSVTTPYTICAALIVFVKFSLRKNILTLNSLDIWFLLFLFWYCVSGLWAPDQDAAISGVIELCLAALSVYFLAKLTFSMGDQDKRFKEFVFGFCVLGSLIAPMFFGYHDVARGRLIIEGQGNITVGVTQAFVNTAIAGLGLFLWPRGESIFIRLIAVIALALSLYSLNITGTRGALIGFGSGATVLLALNKNFMRLFRPGISTIAVMVLSATAITTQMDWSFIADSRIFRFENYGNANDASSFERILSFNAAWEMIISSPTIGSGISSYRTETAFEYPHNIILEVWVHSGIIGLSLFAIFVWVATYSAFRVMRMEHNFFTAVLVAIIAAGLAHHQVSFYLAAGKQIFLIGAISGLLATKGSGRGLILPASTNDLFRGLPRRLPDFPKTVSRLEQVIA